MKHICWLLMYLMLEMRRSLLSMDVSSLLYVGGYIVTVVLSLVLYYVTSLMDPGYVPVIKQVPVLTDLLAALCHVWCCSCSRLMLLVRSQEGYLVSACHSVWPSWLLLWIKVTILETLWVQQLFLVSENAVRADITQKERSPIPGISRPTGKRHELNSRLSLVT